MCVCVDLQFTFKKNFVGYVTSEKATTGTIDQQSSDSTKGESHACRSMKYKT